MNLDSAYGRRLESSYAAALDDTLWGSASILIDDSPAFLKVVAVGAAREPHVRIVPDDCSPCIPVERRARRARTRARHCVLRSPAEVFRHTGAAKRHAGPMPDAVLLHTARHRTRRSDGEEGRGWRHDPRALLACRADARGSLDLWERRKRSVLPIHGPESDATTHEAIERVRGCRSISVIHEPTHPVLSMKRWSQTRCVGQALIARSTGDWPRRAL